MEIKYITIPFDLERAKRINSGEEQGKIITRDGRSVRIICFDLKNEKMPIISAVTEDSGLESVAQHGISGNRLFQGTHNRDLLLSVPEWTTFKDGDILYAKIRNFWFIFIYKNNGIDKTRFYAALENQIVLWLEENSATVNNDIHELRLATETEKQMLIDELKASNDPKAKEYLKRFFPNHSNPSNIGKEYNFEPGQPVIGIDGRGEWRYDLFSHYKPEYKNGNYVCSGRSYSKCLPYNEHTKHLLGTTKDWEE